MRGYFSKEFGTVVVASIIIAIGVWLIYIISELPGRQVAILVFVVIPVLIITYIIIRKKKGNR